jgi:hypothetical protein
VAYELRSISYEVLSSTLPVTALGAAVLPLRGMFIRHPFRMREVEKVWHREL